MPSSGASFGTGQRLEDALRHGRNAVRTPRQAIEPLRRPRLSTSHLALLLVGAPCMAPAAPTGGVVASGVAAISQSGSPGQTTTTITQSSGQTSLNWQSFNISKGETVNFIQPSANAVAVTRIADVQGSQILGQLNANGQVWLINPNGLLFGKDAQVNVGALVASTLEMRDSGLSATTFSGGSSAQGRSRGECR